VLCRCLNLKISQSIKSNENQRVANGVVNVVTDRWREKMNWINEFCYWNLCAERWIGIYFLNEWINEWITTIWAAMASTSSDSMSANDQRLCQLLLRVSAAIEKNETRLEEQERREAIQLEWKQIALVCDRVLLLIFVITTAVATCVVLTSSPYGP